jgi:hypothetical protein
MFDFKKIIPESVIKRIRDSLVFRPNDPAELLQILPARHKQPGLDRYN